MYAQLKRKRCGGGKSVLDLERNQPLLVGVLEPETTAGPHFMALEHD